jgi:hypothetical protein
MSEHTWVQENLTAFVAGGLEPAEIERLRQHAASCPECDAELGQAGAFDRQVKALLADAVPGPALEDRLVRKLESGLRKRRFIPRLPRLAWGAAAAGLLVACGAGLGFFFDPDNLPFPGVPGTAGSLPVWVVDRSSETNFRTKYDDRGTPNGSMGGFIFDNGEKYPNPELLAGEVARYHLETVNGTSNTAQTSTQPNFTHLWGYGGDRSRRGTGFGVIQEDQTHASQDGFLALSGKESAGNTRRSFNQPDLGLAVKEPIKHPIELKDSPAGTGQPGGGSGRQSDTQTDLYTLGKVAAGNFKRTGNQPSGGQTKGYGFDPAKHFQEQTAEGDKKTNTPPTTTLGVVAGTPIAAANQTSDAPSLGEGKTPAPKPVEPFPVPSRKIIRSGDIEFEVEAFDAAVATVTRLVTTIKGGYVATVNSDKLPNGKMRGSLVVRVPPEFLDSLVLDLRKELGKTGELKSQRIGSQDITKQYTDLESRLRAARTMEERLLQIIKTGKGEVKDLLSAEKELGVWRTKIEEMEGELRYYAHQVALSTLTIQLTEKEIRAAAAVLETEKVQMGLEVEDVDKAFREAREAVDAAKGRVTRSEVKQPAAGQFSAVLEFEVAPEAAGPLRDRLKQIGTLARLDINRVQKAEAGSEAIRTAPVRRGDTQFNVHIYNLTTVTPRETAVIQLAVPDVPAGFQALRDAVAKAKGRVINAQLNEQDRQNVNAQLDFEIRRTEEAMIQDALAKAGEIVSRTVTRAPEGESVTDTKVRLQMKVIAAAGLDPRETIQLALEVNDVDNTLPLFAALVSEVKGRSLQPQLTHERSGRVTARVVYDVPLLAAPALVEKFKTAGTVRLETFARNEKIPEGKLALARLEVTLANTELLIPKDEGLWSYIRTGLSTSLKFLSMSVTWLIFGLCVVLPWALLVMGGWWLVRRWWRRPATTPPTPNP